MPIISGGGGSGTASPLTTKGDLYGFSNANARVPIGADATILTADSAQALGLRWAALSSGAFSQLYDSTAAGGETVIDTGANGVAQTANHLLVVIVSRHNVAEAVNSGGIRFNNDSGTNYGTQRFRANNATGTTAAFATQSSCALVVSSGTNAAAAFASNVFFVPYYRSAQQKTALGIAGFIQATGTVGTMEGALLVGGWNGTSAITRIQYVPPASLIADSRMTIYGMT